MNEHRKRTNRIQVRLNDDEYDYFLYNLERSGLSKEAYLRKLIADKIPKTKEVGQYEKDVLAQLYAIGNNLNQISRRAHSMNVINVERFYDAVNKFDETMQVFLDRM